MFENGIYSTNTTYLIYIRVNDDMIYFILFKSKFFFLSFFFIVKDHWAIQLLEERLGWNLVAKNMADFGLCWRQIHATGPKSPSELPLANCGPVLQTTFSPPWFLIKDCQAVSFFLSWFKTIQDAEFCIVKNGATALPQFFLKKKYLFSPVRCTFCFIYAAK